MGLFSKRWEPDGRDALSPGARIALSIVVTAVAAFILEYAGTKAWRAYEYTSPATFYIVVGIFALTLGPALAMMRKWSILVPMAMVGVLMLRSSSSITTTRFPGRSRRRASCPR